MGEPTPHAQDTKQVSYPPGRATLPVPARTGRPGFRSVATSIDADMHRTALPHPPGDENVKGESPQARFLRNQGGRRLPCSALARGRPRVSPCALHSRARLEPSAWPAKIFSMSVARNVWESQILWSASEDRALKPPERQLLDVIASGELDDHLVAIADAVHARRELLHTVRSATAIAQLCVGDTVVFNKNVRPRYLEHELAVITELDEHWVTLRPVRPVGRFRDGELRCPPLAVRKLEPASS